MFVPLLKLALFGFVISDAAAGVSSKNREVSLQLAHPVSHGLAHKAARQLENCVSCVNPMARRINSEIRMKRLKSPLFYIEVNFGGKQNKLWFIHPRIVQASIFLQSWFENCIAVYASVTFWVRLFRPIMKLYHFGPMRPPDRNKHRLLIRAANLATEKTRIYDDIPHARLLIYEEKGLQALTIPGEIIVSTGLVNRNLPVKVQAAILAHEYGHNHYKHSDRMLMLSSAIAVTIATISSTIDRIALPLGLFSKVFKSFIGIALARLFTVPITEMTQTCNEYDCDEYAAHAVGEDAMILGLQATSGVPAWLIRLQSALNWVFLPASQFREVVIKKKPRGAVEKVKSFFLRKARSHPTTEDRILALQTLKRRRIYAERNFLLMD